MHQDQSTHVNRLFFHRRQLSLAHWFCKTTSCANKRSKSVKSISRQVFPFYFMYRCVSPFARTNKRLARTDNPRYYRYPMHATSWRELLSEVGKSGVDCGQPQSENDLVGRIEVWERRAALLRDTYVSYENGDLSLVNAFTAHVQLGDWNRGKNTVYYRLSLTWNCLLIDRIA